MAIVAPDALEGLLQQLRSRLQDIPYVCLSSRIVHLYFLSYADKSNRDRSVDPQSFAWKLLLTVLGALALWITLGRERDQPIRYKVPSPKLPEKDEFLDRPSIKVSASFGPSDGYHSATRLTV